MGAIPPVYLVGAGPGDPDLLTVKALRLMQQVDAVVYDKLVSRPILDLIPAGTTRIFAGKTAKNHYMPQQEINELLVSLARNGRRVMRLKGGDPFLFGRGGEEAVYLVKHGIPFEVVPGITSSAGCAAYAGIPLTHRDLAHSVRFVTGHTQDGDFVGLDWKSLADPATTLVVYMGRTNVRRIAGELIRAGLDPTTPTAAINKGTTPEQRVLLATLETIAETIERADLSGPTLMIIGKVASLTETLAWFADAAGGEAKARS
ncbi:MAG: uroporphyrinogen-III C-methyltransferase [Rhodospirillales bacterium]|nr:uroporphyrinogen-III C-methyltransferase [Rhodospirillales bacterium]